MTDKIHRETYITPIAVSFISTIIPSLATEAFGAYKKRDFTDPYFQVSVGEHSHASAAIALTVAAIEAYRNRVYWLEKKEISRNVVKDIVRMFTNVRRLPDFPSTQFESVIGEVFSVRNVILHHLYEVEVDFSNGYRKMTSYQYNKLKGYGDKLFDKSVNKEKLETNLLGLKVMPPKIGFEELFIVLLVFDLFVGIAEQAFGRGYVSPNLVYELDNRWVENLSEFLTHYYHQIPNTQFVSRLDGLSTDLRTSFGSFIPDNGDYFIINSCPRCHSFGFKMTSLLWQCKNCNLKFEIGGA